MTPKSTPVRAAALLRAALIAGVAAATLAGCTTNRQEIVGSIPDDYRVNHPIVIANQLVTLDIPVANETPSLGRDMASNIMAFGDRFMAGGGSVLTIVVPQGSGNAAAARYLAPQIRRALAHGGVPAQAIQVGSYQSEPSDYEAPIRLAFDHIAAQTAPCGPWTDQLSDTRGNRNYAAFGCSTQSNLAAMISNPADLLHPRRSTPADADRRATVLSGYRTGSAFQGDYSREPNNTIASVGGQ